MIKGLSIALALLCALLPSPAMAAAQQQQQQHQTPQSLAASAPAPAAAGANSPANPTALTPAEAQRVVETLQDPQKRAQLIATLQAIARSLPQPAATAAAPLPPAKPAAAPAKPAPAVRLAPHSLGAQLLFVTSRWADRLTREVAATAQTITDAPLLVDWISSIAADPAERQAVLNAIWRAALVVGGALLLEWLAGLVAMRPIGLLAKHAPPGGPGDRALPTEAPPPSQGAWPLLRRLPFTVVRLVLDLVPVGIFWGAGTLLAGLAEIPLTRSSILIVVNAYAIVRVVITLGRMLASPEFGRLRLLDVDDQQARYLVRWLRLITGIALFGTAAAELAQLFGLYQSAFDTMVRLVALIVAVLAAILVLRNRRAVAQRLRAAPDAQGGIARWRNWLAAIWHYLALVAIVAAWILSAAGVRNGLGGLRLLLGSIAIVIAARLLAIVALGILDRAFGLSLGSAAADGPPLTGAASRAARYHPVARFIVGAVITAVTAMALLQFWGADTIWWFSRGVGARLVSAVATIAIAAVAAIIVWEAANARLERRLARLSAAGSAGHAARLRTLLPILRAALFVTVLSIVGLTALSEVGIDIAPLLAGAGIVGVAVGFGSQKLVQDVITGMFVLFENAIQIGDTITVAGLTGSVEQLSVRNIWLRGGDGAVHIIPFSAVTSISNSNRGVGNAAISVTVALQEDSDRVAKALRDIAAEMRADPAFAPLMLGDLQLWVDAVKAWGVTMAGQIACTDAGRWPVQRDFNRRLQLRFRELGIELSDWYGLQQPRPAS